METITFTKEKKDPVRTEVLKAWSRKKTYNKGVIAEAIVMAAKCSLRDGVTYFVVSSSVGYHVSKDLSANGLHKYFEVEGTSVSLCSPVLPSIR